MRNRNGPRGSGADHIHHHHVTPVSSACYPATRMLCFSICFQNTSVQLLLSARKSTHILYINETIIKSQFHNT